MKSFLMGCLMVLAGGALVSGADANPYLTVSKWRGTFTQSFHVSGSETSPDGCEVTAHWNHEISVATTLNVLFTGPLGATWTANFFGEVGGTNDPFSGSINIDEFLQGICSDGTTTFQVDNGRMLGSLGLQIQTVPSPTYTVSFPGIMTDDSINGSPSPSMGEPWVKANITNPLPPVTNKVVLDGSASFPVNSEDVVLEFLLSDSVNLLQNAKKQVTWHLEPEGDLQLVVEIPDYETWIPEANLKNASGNYEGNTLPITATLQQTDGTPSKVQAEKIRFELSTVSHQPGVCMNFPPKDGALADPDLQFNPRQNDPQKFTVSENGTVVETTTVPGVTQATATLGAYDYGAYGVLRVTAFVGGQPILGQLKSDPQMTDILLPKRSSDSFIADAWKQQMGVTGAKDDEDLDDSPVGDGDPGDGLTVYEEYRGFSENQQHVRTNPRRKDLFVRDMLASARSVSGLALWRQISGLDVHSRLASGELDPTTRLINFNINGETPHKVDQHGLFLMAQDPSLSVSKAENISGYNGNSTPGSKSAIKILLDIDYFKSVSVGRGKILTDEFASTVAHEVGHGCSLYHHGDTDEKRTWVYIATDIKNGAGVYQESGRLGSGPIFAIEEWGAGVVPFPESDTVWVGTPSGQHSGTEDCIMRYDVAEAYIDLAPTDGRYWIWGDDELTGLSLCVSPAGTGVNAPNHAPQPRYGPAADKRGNCTGQICVNDSFINDAKHSR